MTRVSLSHWVPEASPSLCDMLDGAHGPLEPAATAKLAGEGRYVFHRTDG